MPTGAAHRWSTQSAVAPVGSSPACEDSAFKIPPGVAGVALTGASIAGVTRLGRKTCLVPSRSTSVTAPAARAVSSDGTCSPAPSDAGPAPTSPTLNVHPAPRDPGRLSRLVSWLLY